MRNPYEGWAERYAPFPPDVVFWAKSYDDVLAFLEKRGCPDEVCFDHDLGEMGDNERNGMTFSRAIIDYCIDHNLDSPAYNIQSSNPVGLENIRSIMDGTDITLTKYIKNKHENNTTNNTQSAPW